MTIMIGKYGPIKTADEMFSDGFDVGITWTDSYTPGGPYVLRDTDVGRTIEKYWDDRNWNCWCFV